MRTRIRQWLKHQWRETKRRGESDDSRARALHRAGQTDQEREVDDAYGRGQWAVLKALALVAVGILALWFLGETCGTDPTI